MQGRLPTAALITTFLVLLVPGPIAAQTPGELPGGTDDPNRMAETKGAVVQSVAQSLAAGPTTPVLDDFNRPNENPLSQGGAWSPTDPRGGGNDDVLEVNALHAANLASPTSISYRVQDFLGDIEVHASIPAKQTNGTAMSILVNLVNIGSSWRGYYLRWAALAGTDELALHEVTQGGPSTVLASKPLELSAGDKLMVRRVGSAIEGWVNQSGSWTLELAATDPTPLTGGKVGLVMPGNGPGRFDDFGGGGFEGLPAPPPAQSTGTCDGDGTHAEAGSACLSDPVNTLTGAFTTSVTDLRLPGIGVPFSWSRSYTSLDTATGRLGPAWTDSYATSLAIQPNGDVLLHGDEGQLVFFTKQADGSFVGARGARSTLSSVTGGYELVRRDQVVYEFDSQGRLTSMKDRNSQGLTFSYDGQGQLQTITDSVNRQIAVTQVGGLVSRVTLPDGRYVEYGYTSGRLSSVRDARGGTTQYFYDAGGRLEKIIDQRGKQVVRNVYDPATGRVAEQFNALEDRSTFAWDPPTFTATLTDARSNQWKDVYAGNLLVERIDPLGNRTRFEYDSELNVRNITDARNNATTMTHDASGNLRTRTAPAPLSFVEEWTYNARNDPVTYKDGRGNAPTTATTRPGT